MAGQATRSDLQPFIPPSHLPQAPSPFQKPTQKSNNNTNSQTPPKHLHPTPSPPSPKNPTQHPLSPITANPYLYPDHCRRSQLHPPVFNIVSDRRGGRTAWSSTVTVHGNQTIHARYWYDGQYVNNAKVSFPGVPIPALYHYLHLWMRTRKADALETSFAALMFLLGMEMLMIVV